MLLEKTPVWDLPVRLLHWALVGLVVVAASTGFLTLPFWLNLHLVAGSAIATLVIIRLVWGFTGSTFARFSSFIFSTRATLAHLRILRQGRAARELGHNPLGALMVFALLGVLALLTITGLVTLGGVDRQGPLASFVSFATGSLVKELHQILAIGLLGLISLHLGGVIFESRRTRENLAAAMISGTKRPAISHARPATPRPVLATALSLLMIGGLAGIGWNMLALPVPGLPVGPLPTVVAQECSACHNAYHPSIAPAETWDGIMKGLGDHFGEDASVAPDVASEIAAYLLANSSEHYDTQAANRLRQPSEVEPLRITRTQFWMRRHSEIDDRVFLSKAVGSKSQCSACHRDALSGYFAPQEIAIPTEAKS